MTLREIKQFLIALYLTNSYGLKLKRTRDSMEKKRLRLEYSQKQMKTLNIEVRVENIHKLPQEGQFLLISNHRTIIDPPIIEIMLKNTKIFGFWVSKKELYNSFFFGMFVRNGGSILLDRSQKQMTGFFSDIKMGVKGGDSIFIFPEGTRNKTDKQIGTFKDGSRIIALKNKLPILPVYIKGNAAEILKEAIRDNSVRREVTVEVGDLIDYKNKQDIQEIYKEQFGLI
ncbi:MAG: 1-acyl-sn-glycerol-3-phosphate acyltransferase [Sulfurovum sp.]|nr:1-acyl-sn-glycerol-3-phosphate acyltransferase [Sulfurovum sp.]MCB4745315.1 1-acyl-sn-glycerol-3-phosphate acyltransferase [Sulfurovum sp.]MCB4746687.1 1-acyl-sn-glycerol-3-phosphate acyltransferase [Sulfurovum sp.]MCB4748351.1 1-acyl-sn-glycerol-3-phosphate acyltransferase [Sulfurovum sp.]MCB4752321.1 1-acyl-sn-glycerol-3-phosphate acyltransferase [Sulfurovum sp.]